MRFKTEGPVLAPFVLQERRKHNSFAVHKTEGPALAQNVLQERRKKNNLMFIEMKKRKGKWRILEVKLFKILEYFYKWKLDIELRCVARQNNRAIAETNKYFIIKSFSFLVAFYVCSQSIWRWLSQNAFISIKWKYVHYFSVTLQ